MNDEEKIKLFVTFLKKENCYEKYRFNFLKNDNRLKDDKNINFRKIVSDFTILDYITAPFTWNKTKEGFDFWISIERKWHSFLYQRK